MRGNNEQNNSGSPTSPDATPNQTPQDTQCPTCGGLPTFWNYDSFGNKHAYLCTDCNGTGIQPKADDLTTILDNLIKSTKQNSEAIIALSEAVKRLAE